VAEEGATCEEGGFRVQFTRSPSNTFRTEFHDRKGYDRCQTRRHPRGKVHDDATARLAELVAAVEHTAKGGELTIKITVEPRDPETFPDNHELFLEGEVKISKMPQLKRAPSIFYIAPGKGQITRVDPNRDDLR
jgi:hypothetical protein